jgi:hypothetical protein
MIILHKWVHASACHHQCEGKNLMFQPVRMHHAIDVTLKFGRTVRSADRMIRFCHTVTPPISVYLSCILGGGLYGGAGREGRTAVQFLTKPVSQLYAEMLAEVKTTFTKLRSVQFACGLKATEFSGTRTPRGTNASCQGRTP